MHISKLKKPVFVLYAKFVGCCLVITACGDGGVYKVPSSNIDTDKMIANFSIIDGGGESDRQWASADLLNSKGLNIELLDSEELSVSVNAATTQLSLLEQYIPDYIFGIFGYYDMNYNAEVFGARVPETTVTFALSRSGAGNDAPASTVIFPVAPDLSFSGGDKVVYGETIDMTWPVDPSSETVNFHIRAQCGLAFDENDEVYYPPLASISRYHHSVIETVDDDGQWILSSEVIDMIIDTAAEKTVFIDESIRQYCKLDFSVTRYSYGEIDPAFESGSVVAKSMRRGIFYMDVTDSLP